MRFPTFAAVTLFLTAFRLAPAVAAPIKVACVGDSITQNSGWSDKLGAKLGAGYTSTNYGLSGTTLLKNGDHSYWGSQQFMDSHAANPDIVVIMLGTNDSKPFNWDAHKGEFVGDYEALVDTYAALPSHPKIYLVLCPPAGTNGYQIVGSVIENEVIPDIKQVAAAKGLPTIDVFDAFGGHNLDQSLYGSTADLVHPNGKGAQVIADTVYAAFVGPGTDAGVDASGVDASGAKGDASTDAGGTGGAAGGSGGTGTSTGGAGSGGGSGGAAGSMGGGGTGAAGATVSGAAGGTGAAGALGGTGAAGTGAKPAHASSGGCAVAGPKRASWSLVALALGLCALHARRQRRR